jgi:hypothetical protein
MRTVHSLVLAALVTLSAGSAAAAQQPQVPANPQETREENLMAYAELLRSDIRTMKVAIITEIMQFSETEDAAFWPIYREYEVELAKINDERLALITQYAEAYGKMTNEVADRLATGALGLEDRRQALKAKYYARFKSVLPAVTAARFLQVENQILLLLDLQIAASLPIVKCHHIPPVSHVLCRSLWRSLSRAARCSPPIA